MSTSKETSDAQIPDAAPPGEKPKRFRPRRGKMAPDEPTRQPQQKPPARDPPANVEQLLKPKAPAAVKTPPKNEPLEINEVLVLNLNGLSLRPGRLQFRHDASGFMDLVNEAYHTICQHDRYFMRSVTPAAFDYYCVMAYWLRLYQIRSIQNHDSAGDYQRLRSLFPDEYPLPSSVSAYLAGLGPFTDPSGRQFELSVQLLNINPHWHGFRGSYGPVGHATIDHYGCGLSIFPIMYRLYAETAPREWINAHYEFQLPGDLNVNNAAPNANLNGWRPLITPHPDAVRELQRLNIRATAAQADQEFILPQSVPAHYGGVDYINGLVEHVAQRITTAKAIRLTQLPVNRIGSSGQVGYNEVSEVEHPTRFTRLTEGEVTGFSAHQLSVKVGNSIPIMKYRIHRPTTQANPRPDLFPFTFQEGFHIPNNWNAAIRRYFEFGGQARWNIDDLGLPTVNGRLIVTEFTQRYAE